jgi:hypothetical protein
MNRDAEIYVARLSESRRDTNHRHVETIKVIFRNLATAKDSRNHAREGVSRLTAT